ncbi:hypothetical protein [Herbaspirillum huttiense]|uniref:Tripartite tricarboxylate transporter TctB family protein n=1 Tax=Herbaspirillum huttiense subsp. lycopersici TaxID=3074428 RepID=A0ABU2EG18_9BURK|nr:hypothetical protein [Herbaspirillum huttiense]MDR9847081.1 hypothetical protein [Herbaspirillum huttiense SE1]
MIVFAIIGWAALVLLAIYILVAGWGMCVVSVAFGGRLGWGGPIVLLIAIALIAIAIWQAPFTVNFSMGGA